MPLNDQQESTSDVSFGDLLGKHLLTWGTHRPGSARQGQPWKIVDFAEACGVSDKQVRNWLSNTHLPKNTITIERVLFGRDLRHRETDRLALRESLRRTRAARNQSDNKQLPPFNIPVRVPKHFLGRDDELKSVEEALVRSPGRIAIAALHGMRGVGKTTLAAAYAESHSGEYRAIWWVRAQADVTIRTDLVTLGTRLNWVGAKEKEQQALTVILQRLHQEGEGILLVFDNAADERSIESYLPRGGATKIIVTSNTPAWGQFAEPIQIREWSNTVGADYLVARTGRDNERGAAETLAHTLGGLPLALEQAAAYCERVKVSFSEYDRRFAILLDDARHAPTGYYKGRTVAKTFALAIEEAAKLHPAAEPLIVCASPLAPEPIPLSFFVEAREELGGPLADFDAHSVDEAVATLRDFALIERESIAYDRDPTIETDAIRLHRLVREVAAKRRDVRPVLLSAMETVYPSGALNNPGLWPRCAALTSHLLALCESKYADRRAIEACGSLLFRAASYFHGRGIYTAARPLYERALAIRERTLGLDHPETAANLAGLAVLHQDQGDLVGARPLYERALKIREQALGEEHQDTATSLADLALLLESLGELDQARALYERALAVREKILGPAHRDTATSLSDLAFLRQAQGEYSAARLLYERAKAIYEQVLGDEHPDLAMCLNNIAFLLQTQGDYEGARALYERALMIREKVLGPEHPHTATSLADLGGLLHAKGEFSAALPLLERAVIIYEKVSGREHPHTATSLNNLANLVEDLGDVERSRMLKTRALEIREKVLGPDHPDTAMSRNNLALLFQSQNDFPGARLLFERALVNLEQGLGNGHARTNRVRSNLAGLLLCLEKPDEALALAKIALAAHDSSLGPEHAWTKKSAIIAADAFEKLGLNREAGELRTRYNLGDGPGPV